MFRCLYPGCRRTFPLRMNVGRHMRRSHGLTTGLPRASTSAPPIPTASSSDDEGVPHLTSPSPPPFHFAPPLPGVEDLFERDLDLDTDYGSEPRSSEAGDAADVHDLDSLFNFNDDTPAQLLPGDAGDTLCGKVLKHFAELNDAERGKPVYDAAQRMAEGLGFDTPALRSVFKHVCTSGGAGLSRVQTSELYKVVVEIEEATGAERPPFTTRFPSLFSFWNAVRAEKRRLLCRLGWKTAELPIKGRLYKVIYRDGLDTMQYELRRALTIRWERHGPFCSCMAASTASTDAGGGDDDADDGSSGLDDTAPDSELARAARIAEQCARDACRGAQRVGQGRDAPHVGGGPRSLRADTRCSCGFPQSPVPPVDGERQERILCDIFDGESFRAQRDDVRRMFGDDVRMLGVYLYSDGTTLSTSGGMLSFFATLYGARRVLQHAKRTQHAAWSTLVRPHMLTFWTFVLRQC